MAADFVAVRLLPGDNVMESLRAWVKTAKPRGAWVATTVGSVTAATVRLAHATAENRNEIIKVTGCHEITSLVGTLSRDGLHIHITLSDKEGRCVGGHLVEATIFTTAEIVLGVMRHGQMRRMHDDQTGFGELVVVPDSKLEVFGRAALPGLVGASLGVIMMLGVQRWLARR
mmetsp:Transcript_15178/g.45665  ORF Transcript_15178/g.45665 Transcript_15178/m.45665 type:complete len:172 (-) Transcript_15178:1731-2246(-)